MSNEISAFRQALTDGIRYWEPRRIVYNFVLAAVVAVHALRAWMGSGLTVTIDTVLVLFLFWVLANVAYCAAYVIEIPAQLSGFKAEWLKLRIAAFVVGLIFAAILAHYFSQGIFRPDI